MAGGGTETAVRLVEGSSQDGPWGSGGTWRGCRRSRRRGCEPAPTGPGHRDPVSWLVPEHPGPSQSASLRPMKGCSMHCLHLHPAAARPSCCWRGCLDSVEQVLTHTSIELSAGALVLQAHPWAGTRMVPSLCLCLSLALSLSHLNFLPLSLSLFVSLSLSLYVSLSVSVSICVFLCLCLSVCLSLSLSLCVSVSVSVSICVSLCLCVYMCLSLSLSPTSPPHPPSTRTSFAGAGRSSCTVQMPALAGTARQQGEEARAGSADGGAGPAPGRE